MNVLEWDISDEAPDQEDQESDLQEEEPQLLSTEDAEPVIHSIENSSNEEDETDYQEGGLEVSQWDLFSQAVEPEEE